MTIFRFWTGILTSLLFLAFLSWALIGCAHRISGEGERIGTIVKVSEEGVFHKTWEIEIIRGGLGAGSGGFGVKPFFATIQDPAQLALAEKYFSSQQEVTVTYFEKFWTPWDSECAGDDEDCAYATKITLHSSEAQR